MSEKEEWIACPDPQVADTLRWDEPLWAEPNKPRGKPDKIGEQRITARLVAADDFFEFEVMAVEKLSSGAAEIKVRAGDQIRRKSTTLARGNCHRRIS